MKNKRLLQTVHISSKNKKVRPILVEGDHPLLEAYNDIKEFFDGTVKLAIPEFTKGKNRNELDQVEYYSPVDGSVKKVSSIEFENKIKAEIESLLQRNEGYDFDEDDPDQYEKKALLNAFKLPSGDLSEYIVKVDNYYVLCSWGLENAPEIGELPPPPPQKQKEPDSFVSIAGDTSAKKDNGNEKIHAPLSDESEWSEGAGTEEENFYTESSFSDLEEKDENDVLVWLREHWLKILLGILIFILLLLLIRSCPSPPPPSSSSTSSTALQTPPSQTPPSQTPPSQTPPSQTPLETSRPTRPIPEAPLSPTPSPPAPSPSPSPSPPREDRSSVLPSPTSPESDPIVRGRPEDLVEKEDEYSEGIPTDQWDEIGKIFQMETEEGIWYWLKLKNGDIHLIEFIPFGDSQNPERVGQSNNTTI